MAHILVHLDTREGLEEKVTYTGGILLVIKSLSMNGSPSDAEDVTRLGNYIRNILLSRHRLLHQRREKSISNQKKLRWKMNLLALLV